MFTGSPWSSLSAKGAETVQLLFTMQYVLEELDDHSDHHSHRLRAVAAMVRMYLIFKNNGRLLPPLLAQEALECVRVFYGHYQWLLNNALAHARPCFGIKHKLHQP